ncbi:hypothetical protein LMG28138_04354 [Pararobbsia alpina]|uniref:Uncharacterized protein n=1 Tax=Pararobbsia alpina TaxID=621374 RepID=A0A6S7CUE8_9BURK|nr:hypothetical protein LMG28138_04354 [Pararobbsia alpina]
MTLTTRDFHSVPRDWRFLMTRQRCRLLDGGRANAPLAGAHLLGAIMCHLVKSPLEWIEVVK